MQLRQAMTVRQAAEALNVSTTTVRHLITAGQLISFRATMAPQSHYRILTQSIEDYRRLQEARDQPPCNPNIS